MKDNCGIWLGGCLSCKDREENEPRHDANPCGYCGYPPGAHFRTTDESVAPAICTSSSKDGFTELTLRRKAVAFVVFSQLEKAAFK